MSSTKLCESCMLREKNSANTLLVTRLLFIMSYWQVNFTGKKKWGDLTNKVLRFCTAAPLSSRRNFNITDLNHRVIEF